MAVVVLAAYLACVAWLSLRPLAVLWVPPANLEPFATIRGDIDDGPLAAARTIGGGLLRLAPLGPLLPLLGRRLGGRRLPSMIRTVFAGAMISLLIEWSQTLVPSRVADVDAIILNTTGIALTHMACYGRLRALTLDDSRHRPSGTRRGKAAAAPVRHQRGGVPAGREAAAAPSADEDRPGHDDRPGHPAHPGHGARTPVPAHDGAAPHGVRGAALSR